MARYEQPAKVFILLHISGSEQSGLSRVHFYRVFLTQLLSDGLIVTGHLLKLLGTGGGKIYAQILQFGFDKRLGFLEDIFCL